MKHALDPSAAKDSPIQEFAQCHAGIVARLVELGRLPALLEPAAQARRIAAQSLDFFATTILAHHADEERELFPAVLASAEAGEEREHVQAIVGRLVREHRLLEAAWAALEPGLKAAAKGHEAALDPAVVASLVTAYQAHAAYEEQQFLPLAKTILARNGNHMAALGLALHLRHTMPQLLERTGFHV